MLLRSARPALRIWGAVMTFGTLAHAAPMAPVGQRRASETARATTGPASSPPAGSFEGQLAAEAARLRAARARPEGIVPLLAIAGLYDSLPGGQIEPILRATADDPATHPLVAAQAAYLLSRTDDDRGDVAPAERRRAALGLVSHFWVIGPFGDGRASLSQPFPPETERGAPDPARRYPGKQRDVSWRDAGPAIRQGALFLDALLRPDSQAAGYALAFVRSDRAQRAALRLGSSGPIRAWVNGALVHQHDALRAAALDQDAVGVTLRRGWNRILIKCVVVEGPWRLFARITDPAGRPLRLAEAGERAGRGEPWREPAGSTPGPARAPQVAVDSLEQALSARARRAGGSDAAAAWLDLGRYLASEQPGDREAREDAAALERSIAARPTRQALSQLAEVARDDDERRRTLERALALPDGAGDASERAMVLARLGDVARDQRRETVALARWRAALQSDADCWPASLSLAEEEQTAGMPALALARLEALPERIRRVPRVMRLQARLLDGLDRHAPADRLLGELAQARQQDVEIAHDLARRARARDDADGAIALLRRAAAARPDLAGLTVDLARALEGAGQVAAARAALEDLVARLPDDPSAEAQLGKILHRLGEHEPALEHLRRAVALRPQDPELRRYTERVATDREQLDGPPGEDLARRFAADVPSLLSAPSPASAPAVVLLDRRVVRVHRNGLAETFAQRVVEVKTDRGAEDNKQFDVRYTPGTEEVEIRQARIFRRVAGRPMQVLEASDRDDEDLSEPWYGLYYDNRAEVVRFEGLRAGDVLEVQYLIDDVSNENQMADYFGDLQFIAEDLPKRSWDYTLITPADRVFYTNTPRLPGLEQQTHDEGGERVRRFAARDVAKLDDEPAMPGYTEVAPYLHVSTYSSWREVGAWYWRLIEEQMVPDESLRKAARSVLQRGMTDEQRVRAIHGLVVSGTRYVGLEFGIHGFKPYKATQVLARKFGDCKDKATLLIALLREAGVEAELVLLRTRRGGKIEPAPASLAIFDHAVVYVPKLGVYLDGTAEFSGTRELPSQDQGVSVLRVGPHGAALIETPVLPSSDNRAERRWTVALQGSGEARVSERLIITGQAAAEWREHYQTPGERLDRYSKVWSGRYPGATLVSVDMPGIEDRNRPVVVQAVASVPRLGPITRGPRREGEADSVSDLGAAGAVNVAAVAAVASVATAPAGDAEAEGEPNEIQLPVTVRDADFSRTYARLSERKEDLIIAYPWQHDEELIYQLPPGWQIDGAPASRAFDSPFGTFRLDVTRARPGEIRVRSQLDVTRHRILPADYARFRAFLGEIDGALAARVTIRRSTP
jgi:tetratricopeptide (TPR) repeat protein/transglutaminase-like putative cysteine protease